MEYLVYNYLKDDQKLILSNNNQNDEDFEKENEIDKDNFSEDDLFEKI